MNELHSVRFDLNETLRKTMDLLSVLAVHQRIHLRTYIPAGLPSAVVGDPARMNQVLITLVRAALQRVTKGGISVTAALDPGCTEGIRIKFSVAIAERLGIEDRAGSGGVFHFSVKLSLAQPARPLKILVAGDATSVPRDEPWDIDAAGNGRIALEKAVTGSYDLIVMDLDLPEFDGPAAVRRIRIAECFQEMPAVPIVALIAENNVEAVLKSVAAGCAAYLMKPIRKNALIETIQRYAGAGSNPMVPSRNLIWKIT